MNNHLKLAYDHGVRTALQEAGITKTAGGIGGFIDDLIGSGGRVANRQTAELRDLLSRRVRELNDQHEKSRFLPGRGPGLEPGQMRKLEYNPDWARDLDLEHLTAAHRSRGRGETLRGSFLDNTRSRTDVPEGAISAGRFRGVHDAADELVALERKLMEQEARTRGARTLAAGTGAAGLGALGLHGALSE